MTLEESIGSRPGQRGVPFGKRSWLAARRGRRSPGRLGSVASTLPGLCHWLPPSPVALGTWLEQRADEVVAPDGERGAKEAVSRLPGEAGERNAACVEGEPRQCRAEEPPLRPEARLSLSL